MNWRKAGPGWMLLALALLVLAGEEASADPRWWWNDASIGSSRDVSFLDIDVLPPIYRGDPPAIFVSWVDPPGMGARPLYLAASFDGGCSFCTVEVTDVFDIAPETALAVAPLHATSRYSIQILFTDRFAMKLAYDVVSLPLAGTHAEKCAALADVATNRVVLDLSPDNGSALDIAVSQQDPLPPRFHAVWRQEGAQDEYEAAYARDLTGDGSGWTVLGFLTDTTPPSTVVADPRVSADLHHGAADESAVNVVFRDEQTGEVFYLRSVDSGDTFSATGAPPAGPPGLLNDPAAGFADGPIALDSGAGPDPQSLWHGALWYETRPAGQRLLFDAQHQQAPTVPGPPWQDPDEIVDSAGLEGEGGPALSIFPATSGDPAPAFLLWTDASAGGYDLHYRAGLLDAGGTPPVDLDAFPFPAERPTDTVLSTNLLLTACAWEEATGACLSNRLAGRATGAAVDEEWGEVFAVWRDDRSGSPEVWFKRTDRTVAPPTISLEASCPTPDTRRITVSWPQLPTCRSTPSTWEKIDRYLVHWGGDPGGPYDDRTVVIDDGSLSDPVSVEIDGLTASTTYCVVVVPEDEARNVWPPDFDPAADRPASPANEACITTPTDCGQPCGPFSFGGPTVATSGECLVDLAWDVAAGEAPILYEVLRDGLPVVSGLAANAWTDAAPVWGQDHTYQVRARDACPNPGPREGTNDPSVATAAADTVPPSVSLPVLTPTAACTVRVEAQVTDGCSGPAPTVDVLLDTVPVATGVALPYDHLLALDGEYDFQVRGYDLAGNPGDSTAATLVVDGCARHLHRKDLAARDTTGAFASRDPQTDVGFADPEGSTPYMQGFRPGDADPEPVLAPGSPVLIFYQVAEVPLVPRVQDLTVTADRAAGTVRIDF